MDKNILKQLNEQMNFEFYSAHVYLAMAGYAASQGLGGCENWFKHQYEEEVLHARKIMDFIGDIGEKIELTTFPAIKNDYECILNVFEEAFEHEKEVTRRINSIVAAAHKVDDFRTISFLLWFVEEQIEEEKTVSTIVDRLKLLGKSGNRGGIYFIDKELEQRGTLETGE